jgi:hypothetical protein
MARIFILAVLLFLLSSCVTTAQDPISGRWQGEWLSGSNGHRGPLRATVRSTPSGYRVLFAGRFMKVVPFVYTTPMQVISTSSAGVQLYAERRLPLFGSFSTHATVSPTTFDATFHSKRDHGQFILRR